MDRQKKWRATYRIVCPLPTSDVPVELDTIEEERISGTSKVNESTDPASNITKITQDTTTPSTNRKDESILTVMDQEYLLTESDLTKTSESSQIQIVSPKTNLSTNQESRRRSSNQSGRWRRPSSNQKSSHQETEAFIDSEKTEYGQKEPNTETHTEQITNTENTETTQDNQPTNKNIANRDLNECEDTERDDEHTERDGQRSELVTKSYSTVTAPSRAGSWLKPKVDYHPSLKQFNTLCSSQTKITRSQTRTYSWITRKSTNVSEMTNSVSGHTVLTDRPRRQPMRFNEPTQFSPSFQRRFGTTMSVTTRSHSSSSDLITCSKKNVIIITVAAVILLAVTVTLLVVFLK